MGKRGRPKRDPKDTSADDVNMLVNAYRLIDGEFNKSWLDSATATPMTPRKRNKYQTKSVYAAIETIIERRQKTRELEPGDLVRHRIVRRVYRLHQRGFIVKT
jgi:hypothetical protein